MGTAYSVTDLEQALSVTDAAASSKGSRSSPLPLSSSSGSTGCGPTPMCSRRISSGAGGAGRSAAGSSRSGISTSRARSQPTSGRPAAKTRTAGGSRSRTPSSTSGGSHGSSRIWSTAIAGFSDTTGSDGDEFRAGTDAFFVGCLADIGAALLAVVVVGKGSRGCSSSRRRSGRSGSRRRPRCEPARGCAGPHQSMGRGGPNRALCRPSSRWPECNRVVAHMCVLGTRKCSGSGRRDGGGRGAGGSTFRQAARG